MAAKPIQTVEPGETKKKCKKKERPQPKNWLHGLWLNWIKPIGLAVLVVFAFRWTFFDWNDVPSASMEPTILVGDRIFVNKLAYHLKFPFTHWKIATWAKPTKGEIVVFFGEQGMAGAKRFPVVETDRENGVFVIEGNPNGSTVIGSNKQFLIESGDLIRVFQSNGFGTSYKVSSIQSDWDRTRITVKGEIEGELSGASLIFAERKRMIKRVVAVGGDTIEVRNGILIINGVTHERLAVNAGKYARLDLDPPRNQNGNPMAPKFVKGSASFEGEELGGIVHTLMLLHSDRLRYDNFGPVTVPEDHFFVMGDNRNNSRDSRDPRLGFIPIRSLVGRSFGVAFSIDKIPRWDARWNRWLRGFDQESADKFHAE